MGCERSREPPRVIVPRGTEGRGCDTRRLRRRSLEVEGEGRRGLGQPERRPRLRELGYGDATADGRRRRRPAFRSVLTGDREPAARRPMERVAEPLRAMGASIETTRRPRAGRRRRVAPCVGCGVRAARSPARRSRARCCWPAWTPTARRGSGGGAPRATTRSGRFDRSRCARSRSRDGRVSVRRFQHEGFSALGARRSVVRGVPDRGRSRSTGSELTIVDVGLNPTRTALPRRDGAHGRAHRADAWPREELGEPVGDIHVLAAPTGSRSVRVEPAELPLVIDEVPVLALLAAHAASDSWFLRRRGAPGEGVRSTRGHRRRASEASAATRRPRASDLVVAGGGLEGGRADARGDHRMAMAFAVAALAARGAGGGRRAWRARTCPSRGSSATLAGARSLDRARGGRRERSARRRDRRSRRQRQEHARAGPGASVGAPVREHRV